MSDDKETHARPSKSLAPGPLKQGGDGVGTHAGSAVVAQRTDPYEVLIETDKGHRTIRRVYADDEAAARSAVQEEIDASDELGTEIIDSAPSGQGLGTTDE
jgi:hypothetical protein